MEQFIGPKIENDEIVTLKKFNSTDDEKVQKTSLREVYNLDLWSMEI